MTESKMISIDAVDRMMKGIKQLEVIVENLNENVSTLEAKETQLEKHIDIFIKGLKSTKYDKDPDKLGRKCDSNVENCKILKKHETDNHKKSCLINEKIELNTSEQKLDCQHCEYSCKRQSEMRKHMIDKHSKLSQAKCTKCDKTFLKNCELERHIMNNHDSKPFECRKCGKTLSLNGG